MANLSIDDFIRVEEHLSKKLTEACGLFKILIAIRICEQFNGQPFSRGQFQQIYRGARQLVKDIFETDCRLLENFCPDSQSLVQQIYLRALLRIEIFHDLEWQILVSQLL